jgi:hypothetical protein
VGREVECVEVEVDANGVDSEVDMDGVVEAAEVEIVVEAGAEEEICVEEIVDVAGVEVESCEVVKDVEMGVVEELVV